LRTQTEYIKRIEAIGIVINKESIRQLDTVVHEESGPSDYSGEESNDDVDEAISIAASDAMSKLAGSSSTSAPKSKTTPPLAMRTRRGGNHSLNLCTDITELVIFTVLQ